MDLKKPLVSVIVPVYNIEKYLSTCIESILNQKYSHLEILLIDDGSTDNSGEVCDQYGEKDKRIRVFHKKNGGLSDARNFAIERATGEYLSFIDSDDWVSHEMIQEIMRGVLETDAEIGICGFQRVYKNRTINVCTCTSGVYPSDVAFAKLLRNKEIQDHACTKIFKKSLFEGIKFPVGKIYEDIRTTYKLFLKSKKIYVINKPLYYYRQRISSIARDSFNEKKMQYLIAVDELAQNTTVLESQSLQRDLVHRKAVVGCYLYKDLLLQEIQNPRRYYSEEAAFLSKIIKQDWINIVLSESANCKIIMALSLLGHNNSRSIVHKTPMYSLLMNKYEYFV